MGALRDAAAAEAAMAGAGALTAAGLRGRVDECVVRSGGEDREADLVRLRRGCAWRH